VPRLSQLSRSVEGKTVLVTGAASGMGRATARLFADEGAKVAATDVDAEGVESVAREIREAGGNAWATALDVSDPEAVTRVVAEVVTELGGLDILVNNAGVSVGATIESDHFDDAWQRAMSILLSAQAQLVRAALPQLKKSGQGRIINISSTEGLGATRGTGPYTVAKHGVVGLTRALAMELGEYGITVNCVCPGPILTGMTSPIPEPAREKFARRRVPLRRYGAPEEVAHMTLSLALPAMSFVTGATIPVDGGLTIQNT